MTADLRAEIRATVKQMEALARRRDELIREAIAEKIRVSDIADDVHLSVPRVYQIRDGR